ncbi:MAG: hypothetical protein RR415_09425, partial [Ruthenibacterium sp.]
MEIFTSFFLQRLYDFQKKSGRDVFLLSESFTDDEEIGGVKIIDSCKKSEYSQLDSCVFWGHIEYKKVNNEFEITI